MLPRCSVFIAVSLDGFIARPDGSLDWLSTVERPGEDYGYRSFFETIDTVLVGRVTYETALGFPAWPYAGKRCVVLTRTPRDAKHDERFRGGAPAAMLEELANEGAQRIYVDGGVVIREFLAAGLISDMTISIVPILLGEGVRLFGSIGSDVILESTGTRVYESGLVTLEYRVRK